MVIEITGVNTWNKGAELMLVAIRNHFKEKYPEVKLAVDQWCGEYEDRARYGLLQCVDIQKMGRSKIAVSITPKSFRKTFGLVLPEDTDVILDASGFAFGDQHPKWRAEDFAQKLEMMRKRNSKIVLMPQALGPFENPDNQKTFKRIFNASDLVFAREQVSYDYVKDLVGESPKLHLAPDFTNLIKPLKKEEIGSSGKVCVVPNQRMIEKATKKEEADAYIPLLVKMIQKVKLLGETPFILIHGSHDEELLGGIFNGLGHKLDVVRESDPVEIKRIIGRSKLLIGSRFHALVSALSQGVPSIATSWSHKYKMLFEDYGCGELILSVMASDEQVEEALSATLGERRDELVNTISSSSASLIEASNKMWDKVGQTLGLS